METVDAETKRRKVVELLYVKIGCGHVPSDQESSSGSREDPFQSDGKALIDTPGNRSFPLKTCGRTVVMRAGCIRPEEIPIAERTDSN